MMETRVARARQGNPLVLLIGDGSAAVGQRLFSMRLVIESPRLWTRNFPRKSRAGTSILRAGVPVRNLRHVHFGL
jgi:hypothetical protein